MDDAVGADPGGHDRASHHPVGLGSAGGRPPRHPGAAAPLLEAAHEAMLLLDAAGRVTEGNALAHAVLAEADGLRWHEGRLQARTTSETRDLLAAIAATARGALESRRSRQIALSRRDGRPALVIRLIPWRETGAWNLLRQPSVLAVVHDDRAAEIPDNAARFGLTPAETSLAEELLSGGCLKDIAARRGRSLATLRTQLARLMAKTQTRRQVDLVRKLMQPDDGAVWRDPMEEDLLAEAAIWDADAAQHARVA